MSKWYELVFEWDQDKAESNLKKHGVSFDRAILVFADENSIEYYGADHSVFENRYNIIGMADDVLFVVYTERRDAIRIISARAATSRERRLYYDR